MNNTIMARKNHRSNTPDRNSYMVTDPSFHKPSKNLERDMFGSAGELRQTSPIDKGYRIH